eukprot:5231967-Alexandrium_andersonii.AAC.1
MAITCERVVGACHFDPHAVHAYDTDGPGSSSDPTHRRCGWGVASLLGAVPPTFGGGWFGGLGDEPRSAARADLLGMLKALQLSQARAARTT